MEELKQIYIYMWEAVLINDFDYLRTIIDPQFSITFSDKDWPLETCFGYLPNHHIHHVTHERIDLVPEETCVILKAQTKLTFMNSQPDQWLTIHLSGEKINGRWQIISGTLKQQ